jgi:hypothetical protein
MPQKTLVVDFSYLKFLTMETVLKPSHSEYYEECRLMGCYAVWLL